MKNREANRMMTKGTRFVAGAVMLTAILLGSGCEIRQRMWDQPKYEPLEKSTLFSDNRASRDLIDGTVSQGNLKLDSHLHEGRLNDAEATTFPFPITEEILERGHERYDIYCSVCHGKSGYANGMVVQRGYKKPPSFHEQRLREARPGYLYGVIKNGYGVMSDYSDQIKVEDRWAIVAYLQTLQYSQQVPESNLSQQAKDKLQAK